MLTLLIMKKPFLDCGIEFHCFNNRYYNNNNTHYFLKLIIMLVLCVWFYLISN